MSPGSETVRRSVPQAKPEADRILRFAQAMAILRSADVINRGEARKWINCEYPNAELVLSEHLKESPEPAEHRIPVTTIEPDDGGLAHIDPLDEEHS